MKHPFLLSTLLALAPAWIQAGVRDTVNINRNWQFHLGDVNGPENFGQYKFQTVSLPHDYLISQPWVAPDASERPDNSDAGSNVRSRLSARGFKEMATGWYRYLFVPNDDWKKRRVLVDFQGIMLVGDVWLNGQRIGGTDYGYLGFEADISDLLKYGQANELVVRASTGQPNNSRWYTGGGLYRDVNLIVTDRDLYFPRHPLYLRTTDNSKLHICAEIMYNGKNSTLPVEVNIYDRDGKKVNSLKHDLAFSVKWRDREYDLPIIDLGKPRLWSCEDPYLYTAEVKLLDEKGQTVDSIRECFGVRDVSFSPEYGLCLNGKKVLLKGYANHHTLGALGAAAYPRAIEKRIKLMKSLGYNHIRTSHNPYSEDFLRLCDQYGILVVDELYDKWLTQYAGGRVEWESLWQKNVPEWVKRDRNHPSVVMWSLGNELQQYANLPHNDWGVTAYKLQRELLHRSDDTRLTTVAMHPRYRNIETDSLPCELAKTTDIASYNYRYMYFPGDSRRFPHMTFYQSEANTANMGPNFYEMDLDRVVGLAYWGAIDYLGESMGWPVKGWNQGTVDISLQPKPDAYFVKSMFSDEPTVHIGVVEKNSGKKMWNGVNVSVGKLSESWNREQGDTVSLYTYTNADEVELLLNGRSLGVQKNPDDPKKRARIVWNNIVYSPGTLLAIARKNGTEVARHQIETTCDAVRLRLMPDAEIWHADGQDLMHVRIQAVDKKGRRVWECNDKLMIRVVSGDAAIVAVDNGDMASDELAIGNATPMGEGGTVQSVRLESRSLFAGSALVILRAGITPSSKIVLEVSGDKFKPQRLVLTTR